MDPVGGALNVTYDTLLAGCSVGPVRSFLACHGTPTRRFLESPSEKDVFYTDDTVVKICNKNNKCSLT